MKNMYGKEQTKNSVKQLDLAGIDALLLINQSPPILDPAFYYFSGASGFEHSILLVKNNPKMFIPGFEMVRAKQESWIRNIQQLKQGTIDALAKELKGKTVGINGEFLPVNVYHKLKKAKIKMRDVSAMIEDLRQIKTKDEIKIITKAAIANDRMFGLVDPRQDELEINAVLGYALMKQDMEFGYDPIIAFDAKSALPHSKPEAKKGKRILMIDAGARYKGYTTDITRMFMINPTKEMKKVHEIIKEAHQLAIDMVHPGLEIGEIDTMVQEYLKARGYTCPHSTGHGVGLVVHEKPYVSAKSTDLIQEGMVFTIEPGIYLPGKFGVRIEDDIVVTRTGCKVLTR